MSDQVGICGEGLLRAAIAGTLADRGVPVEPHLTTGPVTSMLVVARDTWDIRDHQLVRERATEAGIPWLPVWTELGEVLLGPMELPAAPGCVECARQRRRRLRQDRLSRRTLWRVHREELLTRPSLLLTELAAGLVGQLVAGEVNRFVGQGQALTRCHQYRLELATLALSRHRFLPDPACSVCGGLPDDEPESARLRLPVTNADRPGSYRARSLSGQLPALMDTYVDEQLGLVRSLTGWSGGGLVTTTAPVGGRAGGSTTGYGMASSFEQSRLAAVLEALERYASVPGGRRSVVEGSFQDLAERALDPRDLGLYPPQWYEQPGFPFARFDPRRSYRWVWGWSFGRAAPVLVPEHCAYYGLTHDRTAGAPFVYEISNGCALGSGLAEAILYGIVEVAERDAFLLTWYARLPAAEFDLSGAEDPRTRLLAATLRAETGYRLAAFDITTEVGIPVVWAVARNPEPGDGRPAVACAAGAHLNPEAALHRAFRELGPTLAGLLRRYREPGQAARARAMVDDPELVREMEDHALLYCDPEAARRLEFLGGSTRRRRTPPAGFASDDLRENVNEAVGRFLDSGMDVVVVDQTTAEHRAGGFACVKVLIPGTLSMTFGHRLRRVHGLPRLWEVPHQLGYRAGPLAPEEVNPDPHPFP